MPPSPERAYDLAAAVLTAVLTRHEGAGADALPDRSFVTVGRVVHDCELVAVSVDRAYPSDTAVAESAPSAQLASSGSSLRSMAVSVHIVRCAPTGTPPVPDEMEAYAARVLADEQRVIAAVIAARRAEELPKCSSVAWAGWEPVGPSGAMGGGVTRLRLGLV